MFESVKSFFGWGRSKDRFIPSMHPKDLLNEAQTGMGALPDAIREAEWDYIRRYRGFPNGEPDVRPTFGLALSGGGVRSATIALGVMQALAKAGKLQKFDYLSTVSGGGYTGSSLTWFTSRFCTPPSGTTATTFPFGVDPPARAFVPTVVPAKGPPTLAAEHKLLIYLRQHANYLIPGNGINAISGVAMVLRGILVNLFIWLPLTCIAMLALIALDGFKWALWGAGLAVLVLGVLAIFYSWLSGKARLKSDGWPLALVRKVSSALAFALERLSLSYSFRRLFDSHLRWILVVGAALLLIGLVPHVDDMLSNWIRTATAASILGGIVSGFWTFWQSRRSNGGGLPSVVPAIGAFLLLYGVMLGTHHAAYVMAHAKDSVPMWGAWIKPSVDWIAAITGTAAALAQFEQAATALLPGTLVDGNIWMIATLLVWCGVAVFTAWFANLNYTTIHRYYRDRLMESFLPDRQAALENATGPAKTADTAQLSKMCDPNEPKGPYHIVNCNVMLNDSLTPVWRQRGGDSFVLTPRYCGSSATGWIQTEHWMKDSMTLATALAISGAAANPGTGTGGVGPTRNFAVSLLMALLNLRLGFWVANPDRGGHGEPMPNHFDPTLRELLGRSRAEKERILQLSDGGHFDNLGLYELIRRKVSLIVVSDGTADPGFAFADLMTLLPRIRSDLGTTISFDPVLGLDGVMPIQVPLGTARYPAGAALSGRGFAIGEILYPGGTPPGVLIYLKAAALAGMETELLGYKGQVEEFPNESTIDQFYTEAKFEAHRGIGYALVEEMLRAVAPATAAPPAVVSNLALNPALLVFKGP